jgi:uncharacterized protein
LEIQGKVALVTGASRGIGAAAAQALAKAGAHVILLARSEKELQEVVDGIRKQGGKADWYSVDLGDRLQIEAACARILVEHPVIDVLVNNAGLGRWLFTEETPGEEAEMMLRLPFLAAFHMTRLLLPSMLARRSGFIVNVNSPVSVLVWGGAAGYASSRWALRGFTESLKVDLRGTGVKVCHLILGEVSSNYFEANPGSRERLPSISKMIPRLDTTTAGNYVVKAIRRGRKEMTVPFMLWFFRWNIWFMPWMVKWAVRRTGYQRPQ